MVIPPSPRRRVLLITSDVAAESGWGTFSRITAEGLQAAGCDVRLLVHERADHESVQVACLPAPLSLINSRVARWWTALMIRWQIRLSKPDVVHVLVEPYALALPLVHRAGQIPPWVLNLHATYSAAPFFHDRARHAWGWVYQTCPAFLVCSAFTKMRALQAVRAALGEQAAADVESRMHRFSFGIKAASSEIRQSRATNERHLLCVGAIKPRKGIIELVRAFAAYTRQTSAPRTLHLVGAYDENNDYIQELRRAIQEEGVTNAVQLHGRVTANELERLYQLADLFAMLSISTESDFEGFGLVFLEAASRGLPCLASRGSGCHEALQEGITGFSAFPHEYDLLARHMKAILDEGAIQAESCRAWADAHSITQQTNCFVEIYDQLTGARRSSQSAPE